MGERDDAESPDDAPDERRESPDDESPETDDGGDADASPDANDRDAPSEDGTDADGESEGDATGSEADGADDSTGTTDRTERGTDADAESADGVETDDGSTADSRERPAGSGTDETKVDEAAAGAPDEGTADETGAENPTEGTDDATTDGTGEGGEATDETDDESGPSDATTDVSDDWIHEHQEADAANGPDDGDEVQTDPVPPYGDEDEIPTQTTGSDPEPSVGISTGSTAPDDQEMPLTEHVEEMALRFMAVGLVVVGVGAITLFYADELINFLWYSFLGPGLAVCPGPACPDAYKPRIYHPLALVLARLKVATLVGFVAALPVGVYQTYRFMRPGLYPRERRYYLAAVPTSLVLASVGIGFAYFAVLPAMFSYFTRYSERAAEIAFGLTETFNLIVLMLGFFAITFQIPLLVMLAIMMGVTTREWLADRRLYFWGGFAALAFLFSPDPTGMAPLMVAITMIALFDGTLLLLKWTSSESLVPTSSGLAARRPYAWVVAALAGYLLGPWPVPLGYYDQLPAVVIETLEFNDLVSMTPVIIAGGLIALFELGAYVLRNYGHSEYALRARLAVHSARIPVWLLAVVVGYFGSPNPLLLRTADGVAFPTVQALAVAGGLLVAYELVIAGLRLRGREA